MKTKTLRQTVTFKGASPTEVYDLIMDSRKHMSLSRERAIISKKVGGSFSAWNGHLTGFNLVLKPGEKIVQAWRATDWWPDHLLRGDLRASEGVRWYQAHLHADRHPAAPVQRPLSRLD
jgi:activator of HSP90 ATPase